MKILFMIAFISLGFFLGKNHPDLGTGFMSWARSAPARAPGAIEESGELIKDKTKKVYKESSKVIKKSVQKTKAFFVNQKVVNNGQKYQCTFFESSSLKFQRCDKIRN